MLKEHIVMEKSWMKKGPGRHMLVKLLSYQEKLEILRGQRKALEECTVYLYIIDDLTKKA